MAREDILKEIDDERARQDTHWGNEFDDKNTPNDWVSYIVRYVAEGAYSGRSNQYTPERFRGHLIKAAALCVAAIETMDRRGGDLAARHYD